MTSEEIQDAFRKLTIHELGNVLIHVGECMRTLHTLIAQEGREGNGAHVGGILAGLDRARFAVLGRPFDPDHDLVNKLALIDEVKKASATIKQLREELAKATFTAAAEEGPVDAQAK